MRRAESFEDFFRLQHAQLVRFAALLSGSTAQGEDLVQNVLIRMYLRWDQLAAGDGDLLAYARRGITNEHASWRRRWSTRHIHPSGDRLPDAPADAGHGEPDHELWQRLQALPSRPRAAVIMRYYLDLTDEQIAAALGCRQVTVRSHISRGLNALRINADPAARRPGATAPTVGVLAAEEATDDDR